MDNNEIKINNNENTTIFFYFFILFFYYSLGKKPNNKKTTTKLAYKPFSTVNKYLRRLQSPESQGHFLPELTRCMPTAQTVG